MKTTILLIITLLTVSIAPNCVAGTISDDNNKEASKNSSKSIEKERYKKYKEDQKYLKLAKKQYWASQSKQVKKTIKQTEKRNKQNAKTNQVYY
ncbi:MAG: hypothetical protein J0G96_01090 [Flavobacteriia bacterium]|nr:hypothetical protein [Flavobacteriia bacterium]OJX36077.1 MAG: hypothetical protein BGO87_06330 [Flavobacteriia bacterium 40-80]